MGYRYAPDFPAEIATALTLLKSSILSRIKYIDIYGSASRTHATSLALAFAESRLELDMIWRVFRDINLLVAFERKYEWIQRMIERLNAVLGG
jgi:hypothetical protein